MDATDWDLLSSYAGLLALAVGSIYAGSFASLPPDGPKQDDEVAERVSIEDAWLLPILGSMALYGLYLIITYFGSEWINHILHWYFVIAGVGSVWSTLRYFAEWAVGSKRWQSFHKYSFRSSSRIAKVIPEIWFSCRSPTLYLMPGAVLPSILYAITPSPKSALLTDILAISFAINVLGLLKLDSFATGCIVLSGLFLYDIWWVFGTEVMLSVATRLDAPIKLLWPKSVNFSTSRGFTMLGLGDVVVPGLFVALALRYDYHRASNFGAPPPNFLPYFWATLFAYSCGLVLTMTVMHVFNAAQPALLYLSPAGMLAFFLTALVRGELKEAWIWTDGLVEDTKMKLQVVNDPSKQNSHAKKTHTQ